MLFYPQVFNEIFDCFICILLCHYKPTNGKPRQEKLLHIYGGITGKQGTTKIF